MNLKLHERRTRTRLWNCDCDCEDQCCFCFSRNTVRQLEPLKPNIHGLKDDRGDIMLEHKVSCTKCRIEWVDVYCRIYPKQMREQDA